MVDELSQREVAVTASGSGETGMRHESWPSAVLDLNGSERSEPTQP
jgi:hypothetical protein